MKAYREYKDSGLPWAPNMPKGWEIIPIKHAYHFQTGATPPTKINEFFEGDNIWANISDLSSKIVNDSFKHISDDALKVCSMSISPKGSLMFSFKLSVGTVAFCGCDMYTNEAIATFLKGKNDLNYLYYAGPYFIVKNSNENIYGAKLLNQDLINNAKIFLPPLPEQQAIASFLDAKTKPIDDIIAKREKQIELLEEMKSAIISRAVTKGLNPEAKMKGSGIEWIGEVPEHWEVADLKRYAKISTGKTPSTKKDEYFENEEIVWFTPGDFPDGSIILNDSSRKIDKRAIKASEAFLYPKNSVFLVGIGGTLGKIGIFEEEASCNQQINVIVCKSDVLKKYVAYYLYSKKELLKVYSNAATLPILNQDKTGYIKIALPPLSEQQDIAFYLDTETSKIDTRIAKRRKQIELLQEYKQALITAAVTGKIDVRELNS